ncbi:hypothetical protein GCM10010518_23750 [Kitasatospora cinereorecta]
MRPRVSTRSVDDRVRTLGGDTGLSKSEDSRICGGGCGCGKVAMPTDAALEDVQAAVFMPLADLTQTFHGVEIRIIWSPLTPNSWVGRISSITRDGAGSQQT